MRFIDIPQFTRMGSYQLNMPLSLFMGWLEECLTEMNLQLEPDFQRNHVWTESQQISYIEFLLRGGKSGRDIYFNCPSWLHGIPKGGYNDFVCVDGLQRMTAIRRFLNNEITAFGTFYKDFEDKIPLEIDILVHINNLKTRKEVLQWYIEMNEGGTPHTAAEINKVKELLSQEEELA